MAVVSLVLLFFSGVLVGVGIIPCLGWVNWVAVPLSALTVTAGLVGLFTDRDPLTQRMRGLAVHAFAVGFGSLLVLVGVLRCVIGLGAV